METTLKRIRRFRLTDNTRRVVVEVIGHLFILLFLYAAANKLMDFQKFKVQVGQSPFLTEYAVPIAWCIPIIEIVISLGLAFKRTLLTALYASFGLMLMFTVYIIVILNFAERIPCSCGGILEKMGWKEHLVFNVFFVMLAIVAILLYSKLQGSCQKIYKRPVALLLLVGLVSVMPVLFSYSAYYFKLVRNAYDFKRNFIRPVRGMNRLDLKHDNFYFAGKIADSIYLGNHASTGHLIRTDTLLTRYEPWFVQMDLKNFARDKGQYKLWIDSPAIFLLNGVAKSVLKGNIETWAVRPLPFVTPYFQEGLPVGKQSMIYRYVSAKTNANSLRKESFNGPRIENDQVLEKQIDGLFCTSGMLLYNTSMKRLIYTYYYRNQILVLDTNLNLFRKIKTIDPIDTAKFKTDEMVSENSKVNTSPALLVNVNAATWKNYVFIQSALMGKGEDDLTFKKSAVIDVYNLDSGTYLYSFYLPNPDKAPVKEFTVFDGDIYTLSEHYLNKYKLKLTSQP